MVGRTLASKRKQKALTTKEQCAILASLVNCKCKLLFTEITNPRQLGNVRWNSRQLKHCSIETYIKSCPLVATYTRVRTGLQLLNSEDANASMLKVAVSTLCKRYVGIINNGRYIVYVPKLCRFDSRLVAYGFFCRPALFWPACSFILETGKGDVRFAKMPPKGW